MSPSEVVAPRARVSACFNLRELKLMTWLVHAVLRGARDSEIQATVVRKPEWATFCAKIQKMEREAQSQENVDGSLEDSDGQA